MPDSEYLEDGSEWADSTEWSGAGWYVVDPNGIVAGRFEDQGEAEWWISKGHRI